jgi:pimeloyl-ACP methyl ester carboxylesterase
MALAPSAIAVVGFLVAGLCFGRIAVLRKRGYSRVRFFAAGLPLFTVVITSLALVVLSGADWIAFRDQAPPGTLYLVQGHRMRIHCEGMGAPTIVLDAGLGNDGLIWSGIQPVLAKSNRVCSFDRAGYGWSDPVSTPRDATNVSTELHGLLMAANIGAPVVLVGHSIAGLYIREYAVRYPKEVAGLVFVDASAPTREESSGTETENRNPRPNSSQGSGFENEVFATGLNRLLGACPGSLPGYRLHLLMPRIEGVCRENLSVFRGELDNFDLSAREAALFLSSRLPILILSRWTTDKTWNRQQEGLKALSTDNRRVIAAHSGHYIQVDRPALVEGEISLFLKQISGKIPEQTDLRATSVE